MSLSLVVPELDRAAKLHFPLSIRKGGKTVGIPKFEVREGRAYALVLENGLLKLLREDDDTIAKESVFPTTIRVVMWAEVVVVDYRIRRPTGEPPMGFERFPVVWEEGGKRHAWVIIDLGLVLLPLMLEIVGN